MPSPAIPVHHLAQPGEPAIRVERIEPLDQPVRNDVHRHDFHELFLFERGTGSHMIDLEPRELKPPCVHCVAAGQVHKLDRSAGSVGVVVMFAPEAVLDRVPMSDLSTLFGAGSAEPAISITTGYLREAMALVSMLEQELTREGGPIGNVPSSCLGMLLSKCAHWKRTARPAKGARADHMDLVHRFIAAVDHQFIGQRTVSAYAKQLAVTPGHLNDKVKERIGRSAGEVIQDRLILEAKRLLLHADLSVKEVGYALEVRDPAYFNRTFKKATGMTPAEYRAHIREKYQR